MTDNLLVWWRGRSVREQQMLAVLGALFALMFLWLVLFRPLAAAVDNGRSRHARLAVQLQDVRAAAARLETVSAAAPTRRGGQPVRDLVAASAAGAGLELASAQPEDGRGVLLSVTAVRPTFLFGWIAGLERDAGVVPNRVAVQRNDDATVSAQIGFAGNPG